MHSCVMLAVIMMMSFWKLILFCIVLFKVALSQGVYRYYDFDAGQRAMIVNEHNHLRAVEPASNMQEMIWDDNLASMAKYWAGQCLARHTTSAQRSNRFGYEKVGEAIWWSSEKFLRTDLASVIRSFYSEKPQYDFDSRKCYGVNCAHYTQVVWATSCAVGCAAAYCANIINGGAISEGHIVVCNYGPSGNIRGHDPYTYGRPCSGCPLSCTANKLCPSSCAAPAPAPAPQAAPPAKPECVDYHVYCSPWAQANECVKNPNWMKANCYKSCNSKECA